MKLNNLMKFCREIRGYTQEELHEITGIPQFRISRFESGATEPRLNELEKLSHAFDIPIEMLIRMAQFEKISEEELNSEEYLNDAELIENLFKAYMAIKLKKESLRNSKDLHDPDGNSISPENHVKQDHLIPFG